MRDASTVPDSIDDLKDEEWLGVPLWDNAWKRRFAFIKPELDYYRRHRLGPPRQHFIHRMQQLIMEANQGLFVDDHCAKCGKNLTVAWNKTFQNRKIYCHSCYLKYLEQNN